MNDNPKNFSSLYRLGEITLLSQQGQTENSGNGDSKKIDMIFRTSYFWKYSSQGSILQAEIALGMTLEKAKFTSSK